MIDGSGNLFDAHVQHTSDDACTVTLSEAESGTVICVAGGAAQLSDLSDVGSTTPTAGNYLRGDGDSFEATTIQAADLPTAIDAAKIGTGNVSNTEFDYLDGVTSAIQTQLRAKAKASLRGTIANPKDFYDNVDHEICLWAETDAAITITKIQITCDANPTTELDIDLKWADAFIGLANAAVIDVCDTADGAVKITAGFDDATVAAGKCIYWSFGAAPDAATTQFSFVIEYTYDA